MFKTDNKLLIALIIAKSTTNFMWFDKTNFMPQLIGKFYRINNNELQEKHKVALSKEL